MCQILYQSPQHTSNQNATLFKCHCSPDCTSENQQQPPPVYMFQVQKRQKMQTLYSELLTWLQFSGHTTASLQPIRARSPTSHHSTLHTEMPNTSNMFCNKLLTWLHFVEHTTASLQPVSARTPTNHHFDTPREKKHKKTLFNTCRSPGCTSLKMPLAACNRYVPDPQPVTT
jgi:hypothetical protein